MHPITCLCYLLTASLHLLANLSMDDCNLALAFIIVIVKTMAKDSGDEERFKIAHSIPSDVRTVVSALGIDPKSTPYICCPRCFCIYKINPEDGESCPTYCTHKATPNSRECGAQLRAAKKSDVLHPIRKYLYQDLRHWIGRMYSRPDIEEYFDKYPLERNESSGEMKDM